MKTEHSLGPVEGDDGFFLPGLSGGLDLFYEVGEDLTGEITASPVEREFSAFFGGLEGAFVDVFQLGKGQLFLAVVEVASVRAGGGRSNQWFMVTKDVFVIQIKIIVADADRAVLVFAKSIVKGGVQMVVLSLIRTIFQVWRYLIPFSGLFPQMAMMHQTPRASQSTFTDLAIPSQTPTPCPRGPMISWEYGFFSLS